MYGLERFGDYIVKMSNSRKPERHLSIVRRYVQVELCNFLRVSQPSKYGDLGSQESVPQAMFSPRVCLDPSSWVVQRSSSSKVTNLSNVEMSQFADLYLNTRTLLALDDSFDSITDSPQSMDRQVIQIGGALWSGRRFFQQYYFANDDIHQFGAGSCCVSLTFDGVKSLGIIREVVKHCAFVSRTCPQVYFFNVELLSAASKNADVPLDVVSLSSQRIWVTAYSLHQDMICLLPVDDIPDKWYVLKLLS